jgi:hypothetical protein
MACGDDLAQSDTRFSLNLRRPTIHVASVGEERVEGWHMWASNSARIRRSTSSILSAGFGSALNSRPQRLHLDEMSGFSMSTLSK